MVNNRLVEFLENGKILDGTQCGFRRNRATIDHLVRLDTFIRKSMAEGKSVVAVFFDLAKAYNFAWRFGILKYLHDMGLRGRLPCFVRNFLTEFKVSVLGKLEYQETEYKSSSGKHTECSLICHKNQLAS